MFPNNVNDGYGYVCELLLFNISEPQFLGLSITIVRPEVVCACISEHMIGGGLGRSLLFLIVVVTTDVEFSRFCGPREIMGFEG